MMKNSKKQSASEDFGPSKSVCYLVFKANKKSVVDFAEKKEYDKSVLNSAVSRKLLT